MNTAPAVERDGKSWYKLNTALNNIYRRYHAGVVLTDDECHAAVQATFAVKSLTELVGWTDEGFIENLTRILESQRSRVQEKTKVTTAAQSKLKFTKDEWDHFIAETGYTQAQLKAAVDIERASQWTGTLLELEECMQIWLDGQPKQNSSQEYQDNSSVLIAPCVISIQTMTGILVNEIPVALNRRLPAWAYRPITQGMLASKGYTDISGKAVRDRFDEVFGACGVGWRVAPHPTAGRVEYYHEDRTSSSGKTNTYHIAKLIAHTLSYCVILPDG